MTKTPQLRSCLLLSSNHLDTGVNLGESLGEDQNGMQRVAHGACPLILIFHFPTSLLIPKEPAVRMVSKEGPKFELNLRLRLKASSFFFFFSSLWFSGKRLPSKPVLPVATPSGYQTTTARQNGVRLEPEPFCSRVPWRSSAWDAQRLSNASSKAEWDRRTESGLFRALTKQLSLLNSTHKEKFESCGVRPKTFTCAELSVPLLWVPVNGSLIVHPKEV